MTAAPRRLVARRDPTQKPEMRLTLPILLCLAASPLACATLPSDASGSEAATLRTEDGQKPASKKPVQKPSKEPSKEIDKCRHGFPLVREIPAAVRKSKRDKSDARKDETREPKPKDAAREVPAVAATKRLLLNGSGLCEYGIFAIDVYHGALYLEKRTRAAQSAIESTGCKAIVLRFCRALSKSQLRSAWTAGATATAGKALERYKAGLKKLNSLMQPIGEGETLTFYLRPDVGVEVLIRDEHVGTIEDENWPEFFVRLYLGSSPPDKNLKKGMLRGGK